MDPMTVVLLCLLVLAVLLIAETPVAFALAMSGTLGLVIFRSLGHATSELGGAPFSAASSYSLSVIPMFILLGMFALYGRIAEQIFAFASRMFGRVPGGLGAGTVLACAGFGAVTGSSVASAATMGRLAIDQMIAYGYPKHMAAGIVSAAGTLGTMIPPSVILVLYAVITGESTGVMLIAGIVPGLISALSYVLYIILRSASLQRRGVAFNAPTADRLESPRRDDASAPATSAGVAAAPVTTAAAEIEAIGRATTVAVPMPAEGDHASTFNSELRQGLRGALRGGVIFFIVIGGIYSGVFTPTESGGLGALAALIMMLVELRREPGAVLRKALRGAFKDTAATTSMIFAVLVGSTIFSTMLVFSGIPQELSATVAGLQIPPLAIVALLLVLLIPLGMFLESISILVIVMPLIYPVISTLGFDGVWFGILAVKLIELGMVTPPVGIVTYVTAASSTQVKVEDAFRGVTPFIAVDVVVTALLFAFPVLVLWLPNQVA